MNTLLNSLGEYFFPIGIVVSSIFIGLLLRSLAGWWLRRVTTRFKWRNAATFIPVIRKPILYVSVLFGLDLALRSVTLAPKLIPFVEPCLWAGFILILSQTLARLMVQIIQVRGEITEHAPATTLIRKITQFGIYFIGIIMILNSFGVNIAAIIAAMGIGGLALALALQDTLSNIFAGVYITIAGQIRVGNYIKISDAKFVEPAEGYVEDISWRTAVIRRLDGNLVVLPNNVLSQATVVNYSLPDALCRVSIKVSVELSADNRRTQQILYEILAAQTDIFAKPEVYLFEIHDASIDYLAFFLVKNPELQFTKRDEIMNAIILRFEQENILLKSIINNNITLLQQLAFIHKTDNTISSK
ncbi:MAG: mechanosensitive ion channel [Ignavibacteria bacterium]|nr:mechanosensitive ion channel [Ignavibacteria bacterium]